MLPTFCVTVSQNFSQIDISVIEINSVLGIGVSLSIIFFKVLALAVTVGRCSKFMFAEVIIAIFQIVEF